MKKTIIVAILAASIPLTVQAGWDIKGLGTLGGKNSQAFDINDSGQVVGSADLTGNTGYHAFITGMYGVGMTDIGTLGGRFSQANGINESGQITGYTSVTNEITHTFITGSNGIGMIDLGALPGFYLPNDHYIEVGEGLAINESGQVAGDSMSSDENTRSFFTGPNGVNITYFPSSLMPTLNAATDINDSGQVVGYFYNDRTSISGGYITGANGEGITYLEGLGGNYGAASSVNNLGQAVGWASLAADNTIDHAFITGPNGVGTTDLLGSQGGNRSEATDINNLGDVVGKFAAPDGSTHAFLFSDDVMIDLSLSPDRKSVV